MSSFSLPLPNAISPEDFLRLTVDYCNKTVNDVITAELRAERNHTNDIVQMIMSHLNNGLETIAIKVHQLYDTQSDNIADINLKVDTMWSYCESVTSNIDNSVQALLNGLKSYGNMIQPSLTMIGTDINDPPNEHMQSGANLQNVM